MAINFSMWSHKGIDMDHAAVSVLPPPDILPVTMNVKTNQDRQTFLWEIRGSIWQPGATEFLLYQFIISKEWLCGYDSIGATPSAFTVTKKKNKIGLFFDASPLNRPNALRFCDVCNVEGDNWDAPFTDNTSSQLVPLYQIWRRTWHVEFCFKSHLVASFFVFWRGGGACAAHICEKQNTRKCNNFL